MATVDPAAWRVVPNRAVDGGRLTLEAEPGTFEVDPVPVVRVGGVPARIVAASSRRLALLVPSEIGGGWQPVTVDGIDDASALVEIGERVAEDLHQVDSPVFDRDGNLYVTFSGSRGQDVPVSVFRVSPAGQCEPYVKGLSNATSLAFDTFGDLHVSSRFDGTVYRVGRDGSLEKVASDLGVACGIQFSPDGTMFVGDRTGTVFRVNAAGKVTPFATLPASVAAFHLALGRDEALYVTGPTLSARDSVHRVDHRGEVSTFAEGFGRPQGLAFDAAGSLYVADTSAGGGGIYKVVPGHANELMVSGTGLVGLAFHPERGVVVVSADAAYRFEGF
jgi:sugar lactone lactonase YvrE